MSVILSDAEPTKSPVVAWAAVIGDEEVVSMVGLAFARSDNFWIAVDADSPAASLAAELVPCEGAARRCVVRYIELARAARAATAGRPAAVAHRAAGMRVMQYDKRLSWDAADEPLTTRKLRPRFPQIFPTVELLERVLSGACAVPECDLRPARGAKVERLRLPRCVCCPTHERANGDLYRRRVAALLAAAQATIGRAEREGADPLELPSGLPVQPLKRSRDELGLSGPISAAPRRT
jgi:hypothetical protein